MPAHSRSGAYGGSSSRPGRAVAALSSAASVATAGGRTPALPYGVLGSFSGSLREGIRLVCPALVGRAGAGGGGGGAQH